MRPHLPRAAFAGTLALSGSVLSTAAFAGAEEPAQGTADFTPAVAVEGFYRTNLYLQEGEAGGGTATVSGGGVQIRPARPEDAQPSGVVRRGLGVHGTGHGAEGLRVRD